MRFEPGESTLTFFWCKSSPVLPRCPKLLIDISSASYKDSKVNWVVLGWEWVGAIVVIRQRSAPSAAVFARVEQSNTSPERLGAKRAQRCRRSTVCSDGKQKLTRGLMWERWYYALQQIHVGDIGGLVETGSDGPTQRVPALVRQHYERQAVLLPGRCRLYGDGATQQL